MDEADRLTVAAGTPAALLMQNAGAAVAQAIKQRWSKRDVIVLCGPGNNGGDGFVTACQLAASGWPVRVALLGQREHLGDTARQRAEQWRGAIEAVTPAVLDGAALVVDALFGAGLSRALDGAAAQTLAAATQRRLPIVAIDVPSGVMGDTGAALGAVAAVLTVTFFRKKPGHVLLPARSLCGEIMIADIGTPESVLDKIAPQTFENPRYSGLPTCQDRMSRQQIYARSRPNFRWLSNHRCAANGCARRGTRGRGIDDDRRA